MSVKWQSGPFSYAARRQLRTWLRLVPVGTGRYIGPAFHDFEL